MTEKRLPPMAIILSVAGLLPFFAAALYAARGDTATLNTAMPLLTYGAVVLGFIGAIHWGFVLAAPEQEPAQLSRLTLGVVPGLVGWGAVMLGLYRQSFLALALMIVAFVGTAIIETRGRHWELVPPSYMLMRWILTIVVSLLLLAAIVFRMVGGRTLF
jgi:hypothetical protein